MKPGTSVSRPLFLSRMPGLLSVLAARNCRSPCSSAPGRRRGSSRDRSRCGTSYSRRRESRLYQSWRRNRPSHDASVRNDRTQLGGDLGQRHRGRRVGRRAPVFAAPRRPPGRRSATRWPRSTPFLVVNANEPLAGVQPAVSCFSARSRSATSHCAGERSDGANRHARPSRTRTAAAIERSSPSTGQFPRSASRTSAETLRTRPPSRRRPGPRRLVNESPRSRRARSATASSRLTIVRLTARRRRSSRPGSLARS